MTAADVVFNDMPLTASLDLQIGGLNAATATVGDFNPLKVTAEAGVDAAFTALVVPQPQDGGTTSSRLPDLSGRTVTFDVAGKSLLWKIPDDMAFLAGEHYSLPVTIKLTGVVVDNPTIQPWRPNPNPAGDGEAEALEILPEANSYMLSPGGTAVLIPVSQANRVLGADGLGAKTDGLDPVEKDNYAVELVWADSPIEPGGVVEAAEAVEIEGEGYIRVLPGRAGNAVIGIKLTGETDYRWSWHIWVTEPVTWATDTETGLIWMDRNLGAAVAGGYDPDGRNGLFYQWGRKDAFPSGDGTDGNQTYYTPAEPGGTTGNIPTDSYTELPELVQNPLNFATNWQNYYGSINHEDNNDSWGGETEIKTVYDPCPPGWKVPPISVSGTDSWGTSVDWDSFIDKGRIFNGATGTAGLSQFYPASGYRLSSNGQLYTQGTGGYYWSATAQSANRGYNLYLPSDSVNPRSHNTRTLGFPVRCVAE
ncbi:MAG: fimbrillin family protein [Alistipes sp.]|nr:fimbrillin family protein [Alistipes sp.]